MKETNRIIQTAFAGLLAVGLATMGGQALAAKGAIEKCGGVAKAGKNDCGTSRTSCAGSIKVDNDPEAWIAVPKGTCERIVGGKIVTAAWAKPGGGKQ